MSLTRFLCSLWEIPDNLPESRYTAVVGMVVPHMKNGEPGKLMKSVVSAVVEALHSHQTKLAIFSNRWPVKVRGISLAELEREVAISLGANPNSIVLPPYPRARQIRNTVNEAQFALLMAATSDDQFPEIFIVANHLHMRRVLRTFRKQVRSFGDVRLRWRSVGSEAEYGAGYSQERFRHPLFFLVYEVLAILYSKLKGFA